MRSLIENMKKNQILELKSTMTELKNLIQSFNNRLDQAEERISELEDRAFEIIQRRGWGEEWKEMKSLQDFWDTIRKQSAHQWSPRRRGGGRAGSLFK